MQPIFPVSTWPVLGGGPLHPHFDRFMERPDVQHVAVALGASLALGQAFLILCYWIVSKLLAPPDTATLGKAFLVWMAYFILGAAQIAAYAFFIPAIAGLHEASPLRAVLVLGGVALASLLVVFLIPMKAYVIGFIRAFLFLVLAQALAIGLSSVGAFAVFVATGASSDLKALQQSIAPNGRNPQRFLERLAGRDAPDEIDRLLDDATEPIGRPLTLAENEAAVRNIQAKLQARKNKLAPTGPVPVDFQKRLDRYLTFLKAVQTERAEQAKSSATAPAPPASK